MTAAIAPAVAQQPSTPDVPDARRQAPAPPARGPAIERPEPAEREEKDGERRFTLAAVQVVGSDIYSASRLAEIYEPYLAQTISLQDVRTIVDSITQLYRNDGYVLSRAIAAPQDLEFGILRIEIIEGYVEKVSFDGEARARPGLVDSYAANIVGERPLTLNTLERYVLLIADLPGMSVRPALRPLDEERRAHELVLEVSSDLFGLDLSLDNKSTQSVGRRIALASANFRSPLGLSESLRVSAYTVPEETEELRFVEGSWQIPVGSEGTVVGIEAWRSEIEAGDGLEAFDLDSTDERYAAFVSHPVVRRRDFSVITTLTLEYRDTEETSFDVRIYKDRLRSTRLNVRAFAQDRWGGENLISLTGSAGFEAFGASRNSSSFLSRTGGQTDYAKIQAEYRRAQSLPGAWSALLGVTGQRAGTRLLSAEEFRAGGSQYGRAYDPSEIAGEDGAAGFAELRYDVSFAWWRVDGIRLFAFYDLAAAWDDVVNVGTSRSSIASAGIGASVFTSDNIEATVELAEPLTARVAADRTDGQDMRAFFSVSASF